MTTLFEATTMSRHVHDAAITTPTSRAKLPVRAKPYFRSIDPNLCIGYIKAKTGGRWIWRVYDGAGRYHQEGIGVADDHRDADGAAFLNYGQACKLARELYTRRYRRRKALPEHPNGLYKVKEACAEYIQYLYAEKKSGPGAERLFKAYVYNHSIAEIVGDDLTLRTVRNWRNEIAKSKPRKRPRRGQVRYLPFDPKNPEQVRRRRATANTVFIYLRAALNRAWRDGAITSDAAWHKLKPLAEADQPRLRYLELFEIPLLLNAATGGLRRLLTGGLLTGARPSELGRLEVRDYHDPSGTLHITRSKIARDRHIVLAEEGQDFFRRISADRTGTDPMFLRDNGTPWKNGNHEQPTKRAVTDAKLGEDVVFYTLRHTYASLSVMNGMPLTVLAKNLGHVDTKMVERHYGHLSMNFVAQTIRTHTPAFGVAIGTFDAVT
jgi:integrase